MTPGVTDDAPSGTAVAGMALPAIRDDVAASTAIRDDVAAHPAIRDDVAASPVAPDVCVILDDVRSLDNVGAVMRACDGAGIFAVHACGITPYPPAGHDLRDDPRRGPVAARAARELRKVALSAYDTVTVTHWPDVRAAITRARS